MIKSFKHKGLKKFWEKDDVRGVSPQWLKRVTFILDLLIAAEAPTDMSLPGLRFHQRKGKESHRYLVDLTGDWRITFGWSQNDAVDVDMVEDQLAERSSPLSGADPLFERCRCPQIP